MVLMAIKIAFDLQSTLSKVSMLSYNKLIVTVLRCTN